VTVGGWGGLCCGFSCSCGLSGALTLAGSASSRGCGRSCFPPFRYFGCLGSAEVGIAAGFVFVVKTVAVVVVVLLLLLSLWSHLYPDTPQAEPGGGF